MRTTLTAGLCTVHSKIYTFVGRQTTVGAHCRKTSIIIMCTRSSLDGEICGVYCMIVHQTRRICVLCAILLCELTVRVD